jgi:hypothetical protein
VFAIAEELLSGERRAVSDQVCSMLAARCSVSSKQE